MAKLEDIRRAVNLKIFQSFNNHEAEVTKSPAKLASPQSTYDQRPIKVVSPEKFIESITFTKADLAVRSKFIPTDRNTNIFLTKSPQKQMFPAIMYTRKSPKEIKTYPITGYNY